MSIVWFIGMSLVWSGMLACAAQALTRYTRPVMAQTIWRGAALLTVLPWALSAITLFWPVADLPIPDLPLIEEAMGSAVISAEALEEAANQASGAAFNPGRATIGILLAGWALRLIMMTLSQFRLQRLKAKAIRTEIQVTHWTDRLCLARPPEVQFIQGGSPFIAGIRRPVIYLPQALGAGRETDIVIAHECVHLKRGDLVTRPVERFLADIFWFSPFAWIIRGRLDYWREAVVDEQTAQLTGDKIAYARALTLAARLGRPQHSLPVATFTLPGKNTLKARLNCLFGQGQTDRSKRAGLIAAGLALLAIPVAGAQGNAVHKSEFTAPAFSHSVLETGRLTSTYGQRKDPFNDKISWHEGIDIAAPLDTPIFAPADGEIVFSGERNGYGQTVYLKLENGMKIRFAQLHARAAQKGDKVRAGDIIGTVGQSGRATGPHLHLEVWQPVIQSTGERRMQTVDPLLVDGLFKPQDGTLNGAILTPPAAPGPPARPVSSSPHTHKDKPDEDKECKTEKPEKPERPARPARPQRPQ